MPNYDFMQNKACEFYPCHKGADPETFSCLFCYCPLYALGDACGGAFVYLENGIKDCSACLKPHRRENYGKMMEKMGDVLELAKQNRRLLLRFENQAARRAFGGSSFVQLAFCRGKKLPLWEDDSLYAPDENAFFAAYAPIFGPGRYQNGEMGLMDLCGVNYYTSAQVEEIIENVKAQKPKDWQTLLPWLEQARAFRGIYILGL